MLLITAGVLGKSSVIFTDFWYSSDPLEGLAIIRIFEGKKGNVGSFRRSSKIFSRAFTIKIITDNRISLKGASLLISKFYKIKKGGGLIEAFIRTFIDIGIFIIESFRIYEYDTVFFILDYF